MEEMNKPISLTDLELARKALTDSKAAEGLLRHIYPKIFQVARITSGNRRQADDIAQTAAMEIMSGLTGYAGTGSLEAWAGRITYRVAMRTLKKEQWTAKMYPPLQDDNLPGPENPEKILSRRQLFEALISEMEIIPRKRRISLLLHLVYGYTVSEVAEVTAVSPNTVKDRLKTAYREMRAILDEHPHLRAAMLEEIA